jgi:hypothetical protein
MPLEQNGQCGTDRPNPPVSWKHSTTPNITWTWHHTIPWNQLCATWNWMVENEDWTSLKAFLYLIGADNGETVVAEIRADQLTRRDELHQMIAWQKWNVVEGPGGTNRARGDDPGEGFEPWSLLGLSNNQRQTVLDVKRIYDAMLTLPQQTQPGKFGAFLSTFRHLRNRAMIMWEPKMWDAVIVGRAPKHPREPDVTSTWRRRRG